MNALRFLLGIKRRYKIKAWSTPHKLVDCHAREVELTGYWKKWVPE